MKKLLLLLAVAAIFASCKEETATGDGRLDPNAMISIRAAKSSDKASRAAHHLSALEIVEQTSQIRLLHHEGFETGRGFADHQRDLVNERLLMYGTDIINQDGEWTDDFIGSKDMVLIRPAQPDQKHVDTIAYIKNSTLRAAEIVIKEAFDRGDYKTVYELFDQTFTFIPITGTELQELKAKGEN